MEDITIKSVTHCPTCNSECKVNGGTTQYYVPVKKYTEEDMWSNDGTKDLYSKIENLIIIWNIDGTKTAGTLTRQIMKLLINNETKQQHSKL
jgi:hypothetical protein